jgi:microcystin degradation protein MlrC
MSFRVALIELSHESNTFSKRVTSLHDFRMSRLIEGDAMRDVMRDTGSELAGALDAARAFGWTTVPILAAHAQPGGPVSADAIRALTRSVTDGLRAAGPLDGLFVALHGAMVTEDDPDGESALLRAIRSVVGPGLPIAITLDLHANVFDETASLANIAVSYRTYPHVDMRACGQEACGLLHRAMQGDITPRLSVARPPMLVGCGDGRTDPGAPMLDILDHAEAACRQPGILNVAVNAGFTDADVHAAGPSVLVTRDARVADATQAGAVASGICAEIWARRDAWDLPMKLEDGMRALQAAPVSDAPVVIADFSDNPGSGGYGDCTALFAALLKAGVQNAALGALYDPEAVAVLAQAGIGATCHLKIGGGTDPAIGGGPLEVTGTVRAMSDGAFCYEGPLWAGLPGSSGRSVCLRVDGVDVMIVSEHIQMLDLNIFRCVDIEPTGKSVLVVKSMQHFRAAFGPISSRILVVDAGGLCTPDVTRRSYHNLRRPVFPLDSV